MEKVLLIIQAVGLFAFFLSGGLALLSWLFYWDLDMTMGDLRQRFLLKIRRSPPISEGARSPQQLRPRPPIYSGRTPVASRIAGVVRAGNDAADAMRSLGDVARASGISVREAADALSRASVNFPSVEELQEYLSSGRGQRIIRDIIGRDQRVTTTVTQQPPEWNSLYCCCLDKSDFVEVDSLDGQGFNKKRCTKCHKIIKEGTPREISTIRRLIV